MATNPNHPMTPQDFIAKWGAPNGVPGPAHALNEEQGAQSHFLDLCELLGVAKPGSAEGYLFEEKSLLIGGRSGYADVFMRGVFAWENKAPGKNLDAALKQLLTYSLALSNPPLLVVSDRLTIRIHTQFTGHPSQTHEVRIADMDQPEKLALLRRIWSAPESFKPSLTNRDITEAAAKSFSTLAEGLRRRGAGTHARAGQTPGAHALRFLKSHPTSAPPTPRSGLITPPVATEAAWPKANAVIGNPPFLGGSKKRRELGDAYFEALDTVFTGRVPGGADLVCYWFDKARVQIQLGQLQSAGLVATQAIRAGANRTVLERLLHTSNSEHNPDHGNSNIRHAAVGRAIAHSGHSTGTGRSDGARDRQEPGQLGNPDGFGSGLDALAHRSGGTEVDDGLDARRGHVAGAQGFLLSSALTIFNAWADEPWVNNGAAVRVSLVCFGIDALAAELNGQTVPCIHADLTGGDGLDLTSAQSLVENYAAAFKDAEKSGAFEIDGNLARQWLSCSNPHGRSNAEVLLPWRNESDLSDRPKDHWVIDYGVNMPLSDAAMYQEPFSYISLHVKPEREQNNDRGRRENWWRFGRNGADMRQGVSGLLRLMVTPRVAKYRFFSWLAAAVSPDSRLLIVARADDTTFGILSSRIHEAWSLAQASMHGVGNDPTYNAKSCFESFPFPTGLSPADTAHQKMEEVAGGAWIPAGLAASPYPDRIEPRPGITVADLKAPQQRTLTKLYNQRPAWLTMAHQQLDATVAAAYGWTDYSAEMADEEILKRLLALNLERVCG